MIRSGYMIFIVMLSILLQPVLAQDGVVPELDATFESVDLEYSFDYPSEWEFVSSDDDLILVNEAGSEIYIVAAVSERVAADFLADAVEGRDEGRSADPITTVVLDYGEAHHTVFYDDAWDGSLIVYVRDLEDKVFMVRGFKRPGDDIVEPTVLAILNSMRILPVEASLDEDFFTLAVPFTFEYPRDWIQGIVQRERRLAKGTSRGFVTFITPGREGVTVEVYGDLTPAEVVTIVDEQSATLNLPKIRETPLIINDQRGIFVVYSALFFQRRMVYLLAFGDATVRMEIIVGPTDNPRAYQRTLRAMLMTVHLR